MSDSTEKDGHDPFILLLDLMFDGTITSADYVAIGLGFTNEYIIKRGRLKPHEK